MTGTTKVAARSVTVSTEQYEFSHGGKPRGRGHWMFFYSVGGVVRTFSTTASYSEAKRAAVKVAAAAGSYCVKVGS